MLVVVVCVWGVGLNLSVMGHHCAAYRCTFGLRCQHRRQRQARQCKRPWQEGVCVCFCMRVRVLVCVYVCVCVCVLLGNDCFYVVCVCR